MYKPIQNVQINVNLKFYLHFSLNVNLYSLLLQCYFNLKNGNRINIEPRTHNSSWSQHSTAYQRICHVQNFQVIFHIKELNNNKKTVPHTALLIYQYVTFPAISAELRLLLEAEIHRTALVVTGTLTKVRFTIYQIGLIWQATS